MGVSAGDFSIPWMGDSRSGARLLVGDVTAVTDTAAQTLRTSPWCGRLLTRFGIDRDRVTLGSVTLGVSVPETIPQAFGQLR
jgi:hypothetical protein